MVLIGINSVNFQFSNDESRRLFTNGPSVPKSTKENGNVRVVTYGSVVFQLKDANLEADNTCDFVLRALKVVSRTRVATGCLVCLSAVPVSMLIFGKPEFLFSPLLYLTVRYVAITGGKRSDASPWWKSSGITFDNSDTKILSSTARSLDSMQLWLWNRHVGASIEPAVRRIVRRPPRSLPQLASMFGIFQQPSYVRFDLPAVVELVINN